MISPQINIFWLRRDLRLNDNAGLYHALKAGLPVLPVFIFDAYILKELEDPADRRVSFIHSAVTSLRQQLETMGSTLLAIHGKPEEIFRELIATRSVHTVYTNHDYEPYAIARDEAVGKLLKENGIGFRTFKDQVIFEKNEVVKGDGTPYGVFTAYSIKWNSLLNDIAVQSFNTKKYFSNLFRESTEPIPSLLQIGFRKSGPNAPPEIDLNVIAHYHHTRDIPSIRGTSRLGVHLRFGTISIRELASAALAMSGTFLNELVWREFFMQLLWHHPRVVGQCYKSEYENIRWRNNEKEFEAWCRGQTGYPLVDAGMRELNETGFMHNRVRMITASFLVKHLLVDWCWGEAYFAEKLLDFELSSNNGNWQWVAGCGCDAAPYFRMFNPAAQTRRFDPELSYIRKWVPELESFSYPKPIVEHAFARERCLATYRKALSGRGRE